MLVTRRSKRLAQTKKYRALHFSDDVQPHLNEDKPNSPLSGKAENLKNLSARCLKRLDFSRLVDSAIIPALATQSLA